MGVPNTAYHIQKKKKEKKIGSYRSAAKNAANTPM